MPAVSPQGLAGVYGAANPKALTTTLCDAGRGGDAPHSFRLCAPAQIVWSRCLALASRGGATACQPAAEELSPDGDTTQSDRSPGRARSKPKKPSRAERRTYQVLSW